MAAIRHGFCNVVNFYGARVGKAFLFAFALFLAFALGTTEDEGAFASAS